MGGGGGHMSNLTLTCLTGTQGSMWDQIPTCKVISALYSLLIPEVENNGPLRTSAFGRVGLSHPEMASTMLLKKFELVASI